MKTSKILNFTGGNPAGIFLRFMIVIVAGIIPGMILWPSDSMAAEVLPAGESPLVAVLLVEDIYPGSNPTISLLHIHEAGPATYPDPGQLLEAVTAAYAGDSMAPYYNHQPVALTDHYQLFVAEPGDFGAVTVVDIRDGTVIFAAGMVWMGYGATIFPVQATHSWNLEPGLPAAPPQEIEMLPNPAWSNQDFGHQDYFAQVALDLIRQTDVGRSFGTSAPYGVTSYLHTPTVGSTDPNAAIQVIILDGHAGPPWGSYPVDTTPVSWDLIKCLYQSP